MSREGAGRHVGVVGTKGITHVALEIVLTGLERRKIERKVIASSFSCYYQRSRLSLKGSGVSLGLDKGARGTIDLGGFPLKTIAMAVRATRVVTNQLDSILTSKGINTLLLRCPSFFLCLGCCWWLF